jgi:PAS domain S-box-containing protein
MKLQTQLSIALIPILLVTGGATTFLTRQAVHKVVLDQVARRGAARLADIEPRSQQGFVSRSEKLLLPLMTSLMRQEHARYAMAMDEKGQILSHTDVVEVGHVLTDAESLEAIHSDRASQHLTEWQGTPVLDVSFPVRGRMQPLSSASEEYVLSGAVEGAGLERLGTLRLGLPLDEALATESKIIRQIAILVSMMAISILTVGGLVIGRILRPADQLVDAADQISQGVYGASVPVPGATELARLAKSFNRMSSILSQTTVSKDFLDSILTNMLDPLLVLQSDKSIRMLNRAADELLGYEQKELMGQQASLIIENADALLERVFLEGQLTNAEVNLKTKNGNTLPTLFSGAAWRDADQKLRGYIVVVKDLTERKRFEAEVRQSEKLSAVGRLASGVAHEINNPLGVILGFAEQTLWDLKPDDPLVFPLKSIERESLRCRDLVQELLTFSRVAKTDHVPMDLNEAVLGALSLVSAQVRLGKIKLVSDFAPDLPQIMGNINQIQQVVINLANNALDAMEDAGTLTLRTTLDQDRVCLSVADTGSGIPPDVLPRIFEPFFTTKPIGKGTGLGLGLVHEIVDKHSGTIEVTSVKGNTEFRLKFPILRG